MSIKPNSKKPILRGYFHQEVFFISLGACAMLIAKCNSSISIISILIYSLGLLMMLGVSALYHRVHWEPKVRSIFKRLDHSAIFILIASTATPIALHGLSTKLSFQFLTIIWIAAIFGIFQSIFWVKAPKYVTAVLYIGMGWLTFPYVQELKASLGLSTISFVVAGGITYTVGALFYALKKPNFFPRYFGYHELFHLFTIVGAGLHFIAIYQMIQ